MFASSYLPSTDDSSEDDDISKYRNPSPPPGYYTDIAQGHHVYPHLPHFSVPDGPQIINGGCDAQGLNDSGDDHSNSNKRKPSPMPEDSTKKFKCDYIKSECTLGTEELNQILTAASYLSSVHQGFITNIENSHVASDHVSNGNPVSVKEISTKYLSSVQANLLIDTSKSEKINPMKASPVKVISEEQYDACYMVEDETGTKNYENTTLNGNSKSPLFSNDEIMPVLESENNSRFPVAEKIQVKSPETIQEEASDCVVIDMDIDDDDDIVNEVSEDDEICVLQIIKRNQIKKESTLDINICEKQPISTPSNASGSKSTKTDKNPDVTVKIETGVNENRVRCNSNVLEINSAKSLKSDGTPALTSIKTEIVDAVESNQINKRENTLNLNISKKQLISTPSNASGSHSSEIDKNPDLTSKAVVKENRVRCDSKVLAMNSATSLKLDGTLAQTVTKTGMDAMPPATVKTHQISEQDAKSLSIQRKTASSFKGSKADSQEVSITVESNNRFVPDMIDAITQRIDFPCIGLDFVYEVQRTKILFDIVFMCSLCKAKCTDITILMHLNGFKHHLRCLRRFSPLEYEKFKGKKIALVQDDLKNCIKRLEMFMGRGKMTVKPKVDSSGSESDTASTSLSKNASLDAIASNYSSSKDKKQKHYPKYVETSSGCYESYERLPKAYKRDLAPSTKKSKSKVKACKKEVVVNDSSWYEEVLPDTTMADFYCRVCDSHMTSQVTWDAHVAGKRHRKNLKKPLEERPGHLGAVFTDTVTPLLDNDLDIDDVIVGLDHVRENQNKVPGIGAMYQCYLCSGSYTKSSVIDHLMSTKHRLKYIQRVDPDGYEFFARSDLSTYALDSLVQDASLHLEQKYGRGRIEVRLQ